MASFKDLKSRRAVMAAFAEFDRLGSEAFHTRYGYRAADTYTARYEGREYPSKAIVGVAYGFQYPDQGPLTSDQFSGGKAAAAGHLARLGFVVDGIVIPDDHWTLEEVEGIVERYLLMMRDQELGVYDRKAHLAAADAELPRRAGSGSIGRKLSNITHVLEAMGLPTATGYGALPNIQTLLSAVIYDRLNEDVPGEFDAIVRDGAALEADLSVEVDPPTGRELAEVQAARTACKVDFAERDQRNRSLGRAGEVWAMAIIREELTRGGRADLAERTVWVSDVVGDGLGYDIASFDLAGKPIRIEVKTTKGGRTAPFFVSANEVRASSDEEEGYVLFRVFHFPKAPNFYRLSGPLEASCHLRPASFLGLPK